jgi:hypothetical protein
MTEDFIVGGCSGCTVGLDLFQIYRDSLVSGSSNLNQASPTWTVIGGPNYGKLIGGSTVYALGPAAF